MLHAGELRHRVDIEQAKSVQNKSTGSVSIIWEKFAENVPAKIVPLSGREFVQAGAVQSKVVARITLRRLAGMTAKMRVVDRETLTIYNPEAILPDPESGREYITLPVSTGVNNG
jgi:SPP1 family predicted phage head-tail adaptor